ncbi:50S ribosomal protein L25/general stress protein Ctc [Clostridium sp. SL.3.18]|nr:50S ribosomal protein L25/general stress protein Ctc [Clostridium sp. SL.3.18]
MITLKAEKRSQLMKAKRLRREGFATGVLFGSDLKKPISLQYAQQDALQLIKEHGEGTQVTLELKDQKIACVIKNVDYDSMKKQIMALDFQTLVAGESISITAQIRFVNEACVRGFVSQELSEIHYKAAPANLLDEIVIDFETLSPEIKNFYVRDLKLEQKKGVELITPEDMQIFHIGESAGTDDEAEE